jgi:hypothetical protein
MIPLYGFVRGDTLGLLILADENGTVAQLAENMQQAARVRVAKRARVKVLHRDRVLDPILTLRSLGIEMLDRVDLVHDEQ